MKLKTLLIVFAVATSAFADNRIESFTTAEITLLQSIDPLEARRIVRNSDTGEYFFAESDGAGGTRFVEVGGGSGETKQVLNDAALRAETTTLGQLIWVEGNITSGDGGEGLFKDVGLVSSFAGVTDDGGYHIFTTSNTRLLRRVDDLMPEHYGGVGYNTQSAAANRSGAHRR